MDAARTATWTRASKALLAASLALEGVDDPVRAKVAASYVDRFAKGASQAADAGEGWDARHVRTFLRRLAALSIHPDALSFDDALVRPLHVVAAARLGWAVVTAHMEEASEDDAAVVREAARDAAPDLAPLLAAALDAHRAAREARDAVGGARPLVRTLVKVRSPFAWDRDAAGTVKRTLSRLDVTVRCVSGAEAPVVCTLSKGVHQVEVRHHGGALWRSLTAPGGWSPLRLCDLRDALSPSRRWADHPHVPAPRHGPLLAPDETADPEPLRMTPGQRQARDAAAALASAAVGHLLSVDGTVFRRCPAPRACAVMRYGSDASDASWTIPGQLDEGVDMGPWRLVQHGDQAPSPLDDDLWRLGPQAPCMTVPLNDIGALRTLVRERRRRAWAMGVTFDVLRPDLLPFDPGWAYQSVVDWCADLPAPAAGSSYAAALLATAREGAEALRAGRLPPVLPQPDAAAGRIVAVAGSLKLLRRLLDQTRSASRDDAAESFVA